MPKTPFKIYNASAGSGKTYTLAKAYLKILLSSNGGSRQILAITFTNKAVNEMKDRILNSLYDFSTLKTFENAPSMFLALAEELQIAPVELQKRAKLTLKKVLHNYAFFDVSTIDKFTHRLIRTFAKDLKLPQNFEVIIDTNLLLDEAVSRLINKAGDDSKLTQVLIDFALEKIDDDKSWDISLDLNKVGKLLFNETNAQHLKKFEHKGIDDFLELQKLIRKRLANIEIEIGAGATKSLQLIDENGLEHTDFKSGWFPKFMLKIQKGDLNIDFNAGWKQNFETEPLYAGKCDASKKQLLDGLQSHFVALFNTIKQHSSSHQLLKNIYKNIVPLTVLNAIQQELKAIQIERDQLPLSEFNSIISNEIKEQPAPFIYERLGEKYCHYFIDEFQDTSEMQWQNLIPLIDNALATEAGSLFLVGDAKQAIYRWRGGKAAQFLDLVNGDSSPFVTPPHIENLPANYRSHKEIVRFNNDFFTSISPYLNNPIYQKLFEEGNKQKSTAEQTGYVELSFIADNEETTIDEQYGEAVLKTIRDVTEKKYAYKDICILVRGNKEGVTLANFLTQEEVPIISSESLLLNSNPKIRFLVNLLRYQDQPKDEAIAYDLLSFLSLEQQDRHHFIACHLKSIALLFSDSYDFKLSKLDQISVYDGLEYAIKQFNLAPQGDAYINFFMDTVFDVEQKEGTGIPIYLSYWEKKKEKLSITAPATIDAVQIMTVHKAKGLEFDIVLFPYANAQIYKEIEPKLWLAVDAETFGGFDEVLISKKQEVAKYGELAAVLYEDENNQLELDAFNVLYVALTRAVKALYVISKKEPVSKNIAIPKSYSDLFIGYLKEKELWNENTNTYSFGMLAVYDGAITAEENEHVQYQYSYKDRAGFRILTKSGMLWGTDREDAIAKGNLLHYTMGLIETAGDVETALAILIRNGAISLDEKEALKTKIYQIIQHPDLQKYYLDGNTIKNEKDIITQNGSILRPDRIVIKENKATIIDYKTGKRDSKYKEQIYSYADALEEIGYQIENKIIVYSNEEVTPEFI